jgi:hypothetical protein
MEVVQNLLALLHLAVVVILLRRGGVWRRWIHYEWLYNPNLNYGGLLKTGYREKGRILVERIWIKRYD